MIRCNGPLIACFQMSSGAISYTYISKRVLRLLRGCQRFPSAPNQARRLRLLSRSPTCKSARAAPSPVADSRCDRSHPGPVHPPNSPKSQTPNPLVPCTSRSRSLVATTSRLSPATGYRATIRSTGTRSRAGCSRSAPLSARPARSVKPQWKPHDARTTARPLTHVNV